MGKNAINHMQETIDQKKKLQDGVNGYDLLIKNNKIDIEELFDLYSVCIEMNKNFEKNIDDLVDGYENEIDGKKYAPGIFGNSEKTKEGAYKWYRQQLLAKIKKNKYVDKQIKKKVKKNIKRYTNKHLEDLANLTANNLYSNIVLKF